MNETIIKKIERQIELGIYPGASLALYDKIWQDFFLGTQDGKAPVIPGLTYDLASVSKVVGTGTVVTAMIANGTLALDKPLAVYYPDFADVTVTLRQLLTHSSGIDPYIPNRSSLNAHQLKETVDRITVTADKRFRYTDLNFLLLGFMLEKVLGKSLDRIFAEQVFSPLGMTETRFGPVTEAVPTVKGKTAGTVHDPKAQVLGPHAGSAGLFSTLNDMKVFCQYYLDSTFTKMLVQDYGKSDKPRSLAWDLEGSWLIHTGYTGTFVMINPIEQQAAIFLSNRTYEKDERAQWILDRDELTTLIRQVMKRS